MGRQTGIPLVCQLPGLDESVALPPRVDACEPEARPVRCQQIVTLAQTIVIGLVLAWLYSDMSKTAAGIQVMHDWSLCLPGLATLMLLAPLASAWLA